MKKGRIALFAALFIFSLLIVSAVFTAFGGGMKGKVAVVSVTGPIVEAKTAVDEIKGYAKDASIRAIVLRVDSPGGGVVASQEIYEQVKKAKAKKKVVVSMGSVAASGGYYIAAPADH